MTRYLLKGFCHSGVFGAITQLSQRHDTVNGDKKVIYLINDGVQFKKLFSLMYMGLGFLLSFKW